MDISKLKKGMRVVIRRGLKDSMTKKLYQLDPSGNMLNMEGKELPIDEIERMSSRVRIYCKEVNRTYSFHPDDLMSPDMDIKGEQFHGITTKPVTFDPGGLDC